MGMGSDLAQEFLSAHRAIPSISLGLGRGVVAHPLCLAKGSACGSGRAEFQWRLWCFGATWSWQTPLPLETSLSSLECWDVDMLCEAQVTWRM